MRMLKTGAAGGTGIALYNGSIYAEVNDRIVKYALPAGALVPTGPATTVVSGLPLGGDHPMHPFYIERQGIAVHRCRDRDQFLPTEEPTLKSPGAVPCKELETRGGIWRYDANKTDQTFSPAERCM